MSYLVIGRFQPYHLGHEALLRSLVEKGKVYVGVIKCKSSIYNPFTHEEVGEMIKVCHPNADILYLDKNIIKSLKIIRKYVPQGTTYVTGDLDEYILFSILFPLFRLNVKYERRLGIRGREIRRMLINGENGWEKHVDKRIVDLIKSFEIEKRFEKRIKSKKLGSLVKHLF